MLKRVIAVFLVLSVILTGCGDKDSILLDDTVEIDEVSGKEDVHYNLTPVEDVAVVVDNVESNDSGESAQTDDSYEDNSNTDAISIGVQSTDNPIGSIDKLSDLSEAKFPDEYVMSMDFGVMNMSLIFGECGDYKLTGVVADLGEDLGNVNSTIWESENGTFYSDGEKVYSVNVDGRSSVFKDSEEESEDGMSIDVGADSADIEGMVESFGDIEVLGSRDFYGIDCYAYKGVTGESSSTFYVSKDSDIIVGAELNQDGYTMSVRISDYREYVSKMESEVSGSIDDQIASDEVTGNLMGAMLLMLSISSYEDDAVIMLE